MNATITSRLLDTTREYALEKLVASGEQDAIACRHAQWFAAFADQVEFAGWDEPTERWLPLVLAELGNARVAMRWALGRGEDPDTVGRIAAGFGKWGSHFGVREARGWIQSALQHATVSQTERNACGETLPCVESSEFRHASRRVF
jgi:predicted ATPase